MSVRNPADPASERNAHSPTGVRGTTPGRAGGKSGADCGFSARKREEVRRSRSDG